MRPNLQTLFGYDLSTGTKWIIAFAVILVLLALLGLFARTIKGGRLRMKGQGGGRARLPRLGVVDTHDLDRQRQLVLIRRDNVEHLIMIGGLSDVVVESNIVRGGQRASGGAQTELGLPERPLMEQPPSEPRGEAMLTPVAPPMPAPEPRRPPPPLAEMAEPLPPLPPRAAASPQPAARSGPDLGVAVASAMAGAGAAAALGGVSRAAPPPASAPNFARDHAPAPAVSETELDDMARQLEEALKRPHSTVRSSQSQAAPPAAAPEPLPMPEPVVALPPPVEPSPPMPSPPAPPVTVGQPTPLPLDVAAELELALGLKPERIMPRQPDMPPIPVPPPAPVSPVSPPVLVAPAPATDAMPGPEPEFDNAADPDAGLFAEPEDTPKPAEQPSAPVFQPEPELEDAPEPEPAPPVPEPKPAAIDPFSVDAIEAEFARLLGRDPKPKG